MVLPNQKSEEINCEHTSYSLEVHFIQVLQSSLRVNSKLIKCKIIIFECRHVTLVSSEIRRMINEPETKCPSLISMTSRFGPFQPLSRSVFTGLYRGAEDLYHFIFVATGSRPEVD